jgi:hypothetical protein
MTFMHAKDPDFNSLRVVIVNTHGAVSDKWAAALVYELNLWGMTVIWIGNRESLVAIAPYHICFNEGALIPDLSYEAYGGLNQLQQFLANACAVVSTDVNIVKVCIDMRLPLAFLGVEALRPGILGREIARAVKKRFPIRWRDALAWQAFMAVIKGVENEADTGKPSGIKDKPISKHILDHKGAP